MTTAVTYPYVVKTEGSPAKLERWPRVRVAQIVVSYVDLGRSADEVCIHFPYLRLAEVHTVMAYYFDHQAEIDAEIEAEQKIIEDSEKNAKPTPVELRLRRRDCCRIVNNNDCFSFPRCVSCTCGTAVQALLSNKSSSQVGDCDFEI